MKTDFENLIKKIERECSGVRVLSHEILAPYTTFKVGGAADFFIEPENTDTLFCVIRFLRDGGAPVFILGGGSNVVVSDAGIEGAVVSTRLLRGVRLLSQTELECGCGASFAEISAFCEENGLGGLEEFCGLPGTAGGAVYMNARCYEKSVSDVLLHVDYADLNTLEVKRYAFDAHDWEYKKSPFQNGGSVILSVCLKVKPCSAVDVRECNLHYLEDRKKRRQFEFPSAGSAFKNNRAFGAPSGKIIDEAGLCGLRVGGALVAPWHGNFIINTGAATAADIRQLVDMIIAQVKKQTGYELEPEILFAGR